MRVTVDASVFTDTRYNVLASLLRCSRDSAVVRMAAIWLLCTERERDRFRPEFLAPALRCTPSKVAEVLVGAELGELLEDGQVRIRGCAGRTDWLGQKRRSARAAAEARAAEGSRDEVGRFTSSDRDLRDEILGIRELCP